MSSLIEESKGIPWPYQPVLGPCQKGGKLYGSKDGPNETRPSFDPYSLPPFWHGPNTGWYGQGIPLDSSISEDIKALTNSVNQFQTLLLIKQ
jgi:hypothetical protein